MKKLKNNKANLILKIFICLSVFNILLPQKTYAYLDPGTGSYIFQVIVATIFGIGVSIRMFWSNIQAMVIRIFNRQEKDEVKND